ncbi:DUF2750 domain-containing protein [Alteromonas halophila]|uniref:DUF2750 domain-containing protein n=1 Tax=Alteromonas halophila TaxID=516698 RepID=A0A918JFS8_9ALTE|nr:DUF2750 domain-containing protein [Alteromonas halophila]GGW76522.1 hypothetical protein GCM10007391_06490 [Alteromonas halophila]
MFPDTLTESLPPHVIEQAQSLDAEERYGLFLTYVRKAKKVWLLKGAEGFVMMASTDSERLPVFAHRDLAKAWCDVMAQSNAVATDTQYEMVNLESFVSTWLPGLAKNHMSLVIGPAGAASEDQVVSAEELLADLTEHD